MHFAYFTFAIAATVAAAPAPTTTTTTTTTPYPTPTFTCPQGLKAQFAHFDDLAQGGAQSHPVRPSPAPYAGVYKNLHYGYYDYQVVTGPKFQSLQDGGPTDSSWGKFNMSSHSGHNALMQGEADTASFGAYYGGDYFNLKEFWVAPANASTNPNDLLIVVDCYTFQPNKDGKDVSYTINLPYKPQGVFTQIKLTTAQQAALAYADSCVVYDAAQTMRLMLDDIGYCMYVQPGNPV